LSEAVYSILLLILGLLFIVAEVFFPSLGILSLLATVSVGAGVVLAFVNLSVTAGLFFLLSVFILVPLTLIAAFKLLPVTPFGRRLILDGVSGPSPQGAAVTSDLESLAGKEGRALSPLRPAGIAEIEGRRVDVVTRGNMIDKNTPLRVVKVEGNRVIVDRAEE
jgi:membrane-bound serine protease (ClpP class)